MPPRTFAAAASTARAGIAPGMMARKQNVFDDFISAAEWLVSNRYTSANKLAIHGVSNGGLLIGAVLNQRPALFRAALAQAGVMDMLRFQKFTIGSGWISEFGSSDNPEEFKTLFAYSPIHNIKQGVKLSCCSHHNGRSRRPCGSRPLLQICGDTSGEGQPGRSCDYSHRYELRARAQQHGKSARAVYGSLVFSVL